MDPELQRGPTIPFILGACRDPLSAKASPELSETDLRRLLAAMRDMLRLTRFEQIGDDGVPLMPGPA